MRRFIAVIIAALCLSVFIRCECYDASLPSQEQGDAVKGADETQDKDTTRIQEKNRDNGSIEKTKDSDRKEPEYDMDFEIDFDDKRC